jgi:hypothetical protein
MACHHDEITLLLFRYGDNLFSNFADPDDSIHLYRPKKVAGDPLLQGGMENLLLSFEDN